MQKLKNKNLMFIISSFIVLIMVFTFTFTVFGASLEFNDEALEDGFNYAIEHDGLYGKDQPTDEYNVVSFFRNFRTIRIEDPMHEGIYQDFPVYGVENYRVSKNAKLCFLRVENNNSVTFYPYILLNNTVTQVTLNLLSTYDIGDALWNYPSTNGYPTSLKKNNSGPLQYTFLQCDYPIFSTMNGVNSYLIDGEINPNEAILLPSSITLPSIDSMYISQTDKTNYNLYFNVSDFDKNGNTYYARCTYSLRAKCDATGGVEKFLIANSNIFDGYVVDKVNNRQSINLNMINNYPLYDSDDYLEFELKLSIYSDDDTLINTNSSTKTLKFRITTRGTYIVDGNDIEDMPSDSEVNGNGTVIDSEKDHNSPISGGDYISDTIVGTVNGNIFNAISQAMGFVPNVLWSIIISGILVGIVIGIIKRFI